MTVNEKEKQGTSAKTSFRRVVMFILFLASFLLLSLVREIYAFIGLSVILGIIIWYLIGRLAVPIINRIIIIPTKAVMGKQLYLLAPLPKEKSSFFKRLFTVTDDAMLPTLFMFGIANYLLSSGIAMGSDIFNFFIVLVVPLLGFFIPILKVLLDSDLVRFNPRDRLLEPVGRQYLLYLRGIAGYTAVASFFYTIFQLVQTVAPKVAYNIIGFTIAAFAIAYTEIYLVVFAYSYFHPKFVTTLNERLREKYTYLEVTAVESLERGFVEFTKI